MKKLLLLLSVAPSIILAGGTDFRHKDTFINQEFENMAQKIDQKMPLNGPISVASATITDLTVYGSTDGSSAPTGAIGEYQSSVVAVSSNTPPSGFFSDLTSFTLQPGDWEISAVVSFDNNTSSTITGLIMGIGTVAGNNLTGASLGNSRADFAGASGGWQLTMTIPSFRVNITAATTYYLKYQSTFASGQPKATGRISARRMS